MRTLPPSSTDSAAQGLSHVREEARRAADASAAWPRFPLDGWGQTGPTLQLWTQIVGKMRLALTPHANHWWHVPLYVSARGLTTSPMPYGSELFEIEFDFLDHQVRLSTSWRATGSVALRPRSVADFYAELLATLATLGIDVPIWTTPVEVPDPIPFEVDQAHASYDPAAAHAFWRVLARADDVFKLFRGRFLGKASPVHFFWGGFDLAVTRFSGRPAPLFDGPTLNVSPRVMQEAYSHEVSSAGFWPGDANTPPAFYSYAVPQPKGFPDAPADPPGALYSQSMGEFLLPYEVVRTSDQPEQTLLTFLESTYAAAADLGHWDRALLEASP